MRLPTPALRALTLCVPLFLSAACEGLGNVAQALRDDDGDGWFDDVRNNLTTLTLSTAMFPVPGNYRVVVDEVRFPFIPQVDTAFRVDPSTALRTLPLGVPVARRTAGTWVLSAPGGRITYTSRVELQSILPGGAAASLGSTTITWPNADTAITVNLGGASLLFGTTRTLFADPTAGDPNGDADADGIPETGESRLAEAFNGLGDPQAGSRDLHLIVGWTDTIEAIVPATRELLKSTFVARGITLHIDDGTLNGVPGAGGLVTFNGAPVTHSAPAILPSVGPPPTLGSAPVAATPITVTNADTMRSQNVSPADRRFAYYALLTEELRIAATGRAAFGEGNNIPGHVLAMRSRLGPLWPDIKDYQAGVLMHELGHLLGLCHPTQSSGLPGTPSCPSGTIPTGEQNPATTIMGAPSENPPIVLGPSGAISIPNPISLVEAMQRPIDYSPTQWARIMLGAGLRP